MLETGERKTMVFSEAQLSVLENTLSVCALRFRGYDFDNNTGRQTDLDAVTESEELALTLSADDAQNFAMYFQAQRALCKCGDGFCAGREPLSLAGAFLFLHLYRKSPPPEFAEPDYVRKWETECSSRAELVASWVRLWLIANPAKPKRSSHRRKAGDNPI